MPKTENIAIYYLKAIAICSVALAHSPYTHIPDATTVLLLERFSRMGVFAFFLLAGYFFHPKPGFWQKKLTRLLLPWAVAAVFMYLYPILLHHGTGSLKGFINYAFGNGSYLYWLSMLTGCYLFCYKIINRPYLQYILMASTVFSTYLTATGFFPDAVYPSRWFFTYLNPYLNLFNWIGIFACGIWLQSNNRFSRFTHTTVNHLFVLVFFTFIVCLVSTYVDIHATYWSYFSLPCEILMTLTALGLVTRLQQSILPNNMLLTSIGKRTLPIYLYHMIFVNHLLVSGSLKESLIAALLRPICCVFFLYGIFALLNYMIAKLFPKFHPFYRVLLAW